MIYKWWGTPRFFQAVVILDKSNGLVKIVPNTFSCKGNDNNKENVNIIPNNILELVDRLLKRMSFFMQFDKCLSMKKYQLIYCKLKYQNRKDAWINFIINNTK